MKMCQLTDEQLSQHYGKHKGKPFFQQLKDAMMVTPVIVCCYEGVDAVEAVRLLAGETNGRKSAPGTVRGDLCMSFQENIIHTSDSAENAKEELERFFLPSEIFEYKRPDFDFLYASDEL